MTDEVEMLDSGKVDAKLLLSILRDIRRDQQETKVLFANLTKHVSEVEKRLTRRIRARRVAHAF
jgi:hypothetical protein